MAVIKVGNNSIGKISVIEPYDDVHGVENELTYEPSQEPWVRPSDWLDMPTVTDGMAALIYVPSGAQDFGISLYVRNGLVHGSPTYVPVDWGDGTSGVIGGLQSQYPQNPGFFSWTHKTYNFDDLPPETEIIQNGTPARQAIIQLDASVSGMVYVDIGGLAGSYFGDLSDEYVDRGSLATYNAQSSTLLDLVVRGSGITNFYMGSYRNCRHRNLQSAVLDVPSVYVATHMFLTATDLRNVEIASGAISSQTNLDSMFGGCISLTEAPYFDTSSATGVAYMFNSCYNIKSIPTYDTSNVANFIGMFSNCRSLVNIPELDISNGTSFNSTFATMFSITKIPSGMDFSNGQDFTSIFSRCNRLKYLPDIDFSSATKMSSAFSECTSLERVPKINAPNLNGQYAFRETFKSCYNLREIHIQDIGNAKDLYNTFASCVSLEEIKWDNPESVVATGIHSTFNSLHRIKTLPNINTSNATYMGSYAAGCRALTKTPVIDLSSCNNIDYIFNGCFSIQEINFKNVNNKPNMHSPFRDCYNLRKIPSGLFEDYDSTPSYMRECFYNCQSIQKISDIVISGSTNSSTANHNCFGSMSHLKHFDGIINTEYGCRNLFYSNGSLESIGPLDLSASKDNAGMFNSCHSLHTVNISGISASIGFNDNFLGSGEITKIFNNLTSGVTGQSIDIRNNYGTSQLHPDTLAIATSKGWTVTT
jgi:hypothetical protein